MGGADRIELCGALELGGLTPSPGLIEYAVATGVPVHAMIRPRAGSFVYDTDELALMAEDIRHALALGATGIVVGALRPDDTLDSRALARFRMVSRDAALVPVGRWKGFGGPTNFNGEGFESFSWASAIAASTESAGVFATTHVPTIHPIFAAKMGTTIDHVSNGRFALNIVTGWFKPEIEMFGRAQLAHEDRYKMAAEWLDVVKRLWTEDKEFDFEGQFYQIKAGARPSRCTSPIRRS